VERRAKFYEVTGALRDMVSSHVFQRFLALLPWRPPTRSRLTRYVARNARCSKLYVLSTRPKSVAILCARTVRGRGHRRGAGQGVSGGARGGLPKHDRNLHCDVAQHRQLALGRRPLFPAYRQEADPPQDRDRDPVQAGADRVVPRHACRCPDTQCSELADPA
jgi:hypothetical protein